MSWRNVVICNPAKLRAENNSLVIIQDCNYQIPFEDISSIMIDCPQVVITQPVLVSCAEHGIALYTTGTKHIPNGVFLPFGKHSKLPQRLNLQLNISKPCSKKIWSQIIKAKLTNQSQCLKLCELIDDSNFIKQLSTRIHSGDPDNLEARAAAFYFKALFDKSFSRKNDEYFINSCLNYGYSIIRGEIARTLVLHGLHPEIGIFHRNQNNAFNLADDFIEPYRPIVDFYTKSINTSDLRDIPKKSYLEIISHDVDTPHGKVTISMSIDLLIESFVRVLKDEDEQLELPVFNNFNKHAYEDNLP